MSDDDRALSAQELQAAGTAAVPPRAAARGLLLPATVGDAGAHATRRFLEFFATTIRNRNNRLAHYHAVTRFLAWCEQHRLGQLTDIEPLHVAAYIEALGCNYEKPSVTRRVAAICMPFAFLAAGGIIAANLAAPVRGPEHVVTRDKTPALTAGPCGELLDSIDTATLVGLRDRALIAVMTYSFARIGAAVVMHVEDYFANGKRWLLRP